MSDTDGTFGSGLSFTDGGMAGAAMAGGPSADVTPAPSVAPPVPLQNGPSFAPQPPDPGTQPPAPSALHTFGQGLNTLLNGPSYRAPDPETTALDQTADTLQQRIQRANSVATNPMLQFFNPEGVKAARDFIPQATEQLQKIKAQKADMQANRQQAATLGLAPGEVADEASMADRVEAAKTKALAGDLKVFKGLQAVDPKAAEAIQDQVHETVASHLGKAQLAFDSLAGMQNQGQYAAKLDQLRKDGTLTDLEALGLKVPSSFDVFSAAKGREGQVLREARIGVDSIRQKLEERNTYQPMPKLEAETYTGRLTTAAGDQITNGQWARNGAAGTRGLVINGAADPRDLGKNFTLASPEQRKAVKEEFDGTVSKANIDKYREFNRIYDLATKDGKGNAVPEGKINTNPNVQQGIAEGLASMLRGGGGGATSGLLNIESSKRAFVQTLLDKVTANYAGGINALKDGADPAKVKPYLTNLTQGQMRDVMDALKAYNDKDIGERVSTIANRAGALGLDPAALGLGKGEASGAIGDAMEAGRQAQIARMTPNHQAIGGGDGVLQLGAQRPGAGATAQPPGTAPTTQLPGAQPLQTPVQQSQNPQSPPAPIPGGGGTPPAGPAPTAAGPSGTPAPAGGGSPPAPVTIAGQQVNVPPLPPGASPDYVAKMQRIESGREKDPWRAGNDKSSAGGAFQFINSTWAATKPPGAPDKARDATPQQQAEAAATLTAKNAQALTAAKLPVNDTNLYVAHNLGANGASKLLSADPSADARTVVGEAAAKNNPLFFRGKPTVAKVLERYNAEMEAPDDGPKPQPGAGGATAGAPASPWDRLSGRSPGELPDAGAAAWTGRTTPAGDHVANAEERARSPVVDYAPQIGGVVGNIAGAAGGVPGAMAAGAAGGVAGQSFKDWMQGTEPSLAKTTEAAGYGAVGGIVPQARPVLGAAARVVGSGGVSATVKAMEGGDAADVTIAGAAGAAGGLLGEGIGQLIGRAVRGNAARELGGAAEILADPHATAATRRQAMQVASHYDVSEPQLVAMRDAVQSGASRAQASLPGGAATDATASQRIAPAVQQEHNAAQHGYGVVEDALSTVPTSPGMRTNAVAAATRAGMDADPAIMGASRRLDATTENASGRNPLQQYEAIRNVTSGIKASARRADGLTKQGLDQAAQLGDRVKELHLVNTLGTPEGPRMLRYARGSDAMWRDLKTTIENSDMLRAIGQGDERTSLGSALLNVVKIGHAGEDAALGAVRSINRITENSPAPRQAMQELYMREAFKGAAAKPDIETAARELLHGKSSSVARELLTPEQIARVQHVADHAAQYATKRKGEAGFESALMAAEGAHIVGHALPGAGLASAAFSLAQLRGNVRMFLRSLPPNYRDLLRGGQLTPGAPTAIGGRAAGDATPAPQQ